VKLFWQVCPEVCRADAAVEADYVCIYIYLYISMLNCCSVTTKSGAVVVLETTIGFYLKRNSLASYSIEKGHALHFASPMITNNHTVKLKNA